MIVFLRVIKVQNIILKQVYLVKYSEYIEKYCEEFNTDKFLIYAMIKNESNFKENVVSNSRSNWTHATHGSNSR